MTQQGARPAASRSATDSSALRMPRPWHSSK
jgi:hypothetical protein